MSNKKVNYTREELEERIKFCENVISTTKSYKCRSDYTKALNRYKKEIKYYDSARER